MNSTQIELGRNAARMADVKAALAVSADKRRSLHYSLAHSSYCAALQWNASDDQFKDQRVRDSLALAENHLARLAGAS